MDNYIKVKGINYDIDDRWESGIEHHPKSLELYRRIADIDYHFQDDYFCWKEGGDGDNGEALMYLLDIMFEEDGLLHENMKDSSDSNINEDK